MRIKKTVGDLLDEWVTLQDIADELKLHIETVREWVRTRRLTAYKVGRDYRVKRSDLNKFLEERRTRGEDS